MVIREYSKVELVFSSSESEAVKIALVNLRRDLIRTLDCSVTAGGIIRILVGTVGNLPELDEKADIVIGERPIDRTAQVSPLKKIFQNFGQRMARTVRKHF